MKLILKSNIFLFTLSFVFTVNSFMQVDFDQSMHTPNQGDAKKLDPELSKLSPLYADDAVVMKRGLLFKNTYEAAFNKKSYFNFRNRIPKIIHHIWIGGELPSNFKFCVESCKRQHPDWEHRLWTDADLEKYGWRFKELLLSKNINPGQKADILRLEILFKYGGVYLDTDFFCCKSLVGLHEKVDFYACIVDNWFTVANGVIGAKVGHKLIGRCLDALQVGNDINNHKNNNIMLTTGPYFFTTQIVNYIKQESSHNLAILPRGYFFPMAAKYRSSFWDGSRDLSYARQFELPETLAIHLWATSWQSINSSKQNPLYSSLKKYNLLFTAKLSPEDLINARRTGDNATPLIVAAQKKLTKVIDILGRNGADFSAQDKYGYDVLYYARKNAQLEMVKLIEAYR